MFNGEVIDRRKEKALSEELKAAFETGSVDEINRVAAEECGKEPHKTIEFKKTVRGEVQTFRSVGYTLVQLNINGTGMFAGRAVGLRTDDHLFTADWMLPPVWEEGTSWQAEALKRLNTFRGCSCGPTGRCKFHGETCAGNLGPGKWIEEDMQRLRKVSTTPLCEALEVLMKAEAARANSRIVTPGR